ncbi:Uncharacterised protein [Mycobacteroides abscessus subsp. abscessus]|nr:Uncharacterised protein [Mycobacteroides abscessus subsp. abscessus]
MSPRIPRSLPSVRSASTYASSRSLPDCFRRYGQSPCSGTATPRSSAIFRNNRYVNCSM